MDRSEPDSSGRVTSDNLYPHKCQQSHIHPATPTQKVKKGNIFFNIYLMSQRAQIIPNQVPTMLPCTHVSKITFQKVENCMRLLCWSLPNE